MAKYTSRKETLKEPVIIAFILVCSMLIMVDMGGNLVNEINYAKEMKALSTGGAAEQVGLGEKGVPVGASQLSSK